MPQLYRDIGLNSVWEGAGNVAALDVLRVDRARSPRRCPHSSPSATSLRAPTATSTRTSRRLETGFSEWNARRIVEDLAVALQASLLIQHAPPAVSDAFCASRLGRDEGHAYGTLPSATDTEGIVDRAWRQ